MNILFITHDSSRTGAPLILLHFLQWLKVHTKVNAGILIRRNGQLNKEFSLFDNRFLWNWNPIPISKLHRARLKFFGLTKAESSNTNLLREIKREKYDLVFANTIASCDVLSELLKVIHIPVILHVHELEMAIDLYCDRKKFDSVKTKVNKFIAVSEVVRRNLIANHSIPGEKIALVHEFAVASPTIQLDKESLLRELGIPSNAFLVGGAGTIEWRKGADLFVQVAGIVKPYQTPDRPIYFLWVGGHADEKYLRQIRYDIETADLSECVILVGRKPSPADYFNLFDLFLLPSREDPFPLVSLETGQMGKPIICFDKQVGSAEFIDEHCGSIVPYLGVEAMARALLSFYRDPEKLLSAGKAIKERTDPFRIENQGPKILEIIQSVYSSL